MEIPYSMNFGCPLLELTTEIYGIPSTQICKSVSVVHSCTQSRRLIEETSSSLIEREMVQRTKIVFKHDFSNTIFCYNVFCTNN